MTFHSHQEEIEAAVSRFDFPLARQHGTCCICRKPKNRGLLLCWECFNDVASDKMTAEHAIELIEDFESRNQGDYRGHP